MLRRFLSFFLVSACCIASLAQAIVVRTFPDAISKAGDKPVVLFLYGANYDKFSMKVYDEFIGRNKIMPAVRRCVFVAIPVYQYPTPAEKKEMEKVMGNRKLPGGIWSYPCLAVLDGKGKLRAIVQGADKMRSAEVASAELTKLLDAFIEQRKILDKAERASGKRKSELLLQASNINISMPDNVGGNNDRGRRDKDKDDIGFKDRMSFDPIAVVEKLQVMTFEEADLYIREMIASGCYSRRQRQEMMAAYGGHLRRNGASPERLRAIYTEMRNLDPDSMYGGYAEGAIALWVDKETFDHSTVPVEIQRANDSVIADATEPGKETPDPAPTIPSTKTAMGSTVDETVPEDEGDEEFFSEDEDAGEEE